MNKCEIELTVFSKPKKISIFYSIVCRCYPL